jgi:hypothetical protein
MVVSFWFSGELKPGFTRHYNLNMPAYRRKFQGFSVFNSIVGSQWRPALAGRGTQPASQLADTLVTA